MLGRFTNSFALCFPSIAACATIATFRTSFHVFKHGYVSTPILVGNRFLRKSSNEKIY